jgi:hypothetical protein
MLLIKCLQLKINLGSVFDCDWQGIPKISDLLIPTTYKKYQIDTRI